MLLTGILVHDSMYLNDYLLTISKLQTDMFLHKYAQKKKFSQYRHCVQLFCRTVLILTKTLPNMKFIYFLSNVNIFNKKNENIPLFFIKITQRGHCQNSNFKTQKSV